MVPDIYWALSTCTVLSIVVVQLLSRVQLFATPWTAPRQSSLSFTISRNLLKFMSTEVVMPSNHLILCHPLLLLPSICPSIRVFSELALSIRWPRCFLHIIYFFKSHNCVKLKLLLYPFYRWGNWDSKGNSLSLKSQLEVSRGKKEEVEILEWGKSKYRNTEANGWDDLCVSRGHWELGVTPSSSAHS